MIGDSTLFNLLCIDGAPPEHMAGMQWMTAEKASIRDMTRDYDDDEEHRKEGEIVMMDLAYFKTASRLPP